MLSIESFLTSILSFIKKLFQTTYFTLFKPKLLRKKIFDPNKEIINSEIFLLLSQFSIVTVFSNIETESIFQQLNELFTNSSYVKRIVIVFVLYFITYLFSKLFSLFVKKRQRQEFIQLFEYGLGAVNFSILIVFYTTLFFTNVFLFSEKSAELINEISGILQIAVFIYYLITYVVVSINHSEFRYAFKMPIFVGLFVFLFGLSLQKIFNIIYNSNNDSSKLFYKPNNTLKLILIGNSDLIFEQDSIKYEVTNNDTLIRLRFKLLVKNISENQMLINKCKFNLSFRPIGERIDTISSHQINFNSECVKNYSSIKILNKNETEIMDFLALVPLNILRYYMNNKINKCYVIYPAVKVDDSPSYTNERANISIYLPAQLWNEFYFK